MKFHTINTGSEGNCYILTASNGESIIIEAGVRIQEIKKALNFDLSGVICCLVSHQHGDHAKYLSDIHKSGIPIIANEKVCQHAAITPNYSITNRMNFFQQIEIEGFEDWQIVAFPVVHDVQTHGFLIHHPESGNILFVTDTMEVNYNFPDLNQIIIEANFSSEILNSLSKLDRSNYVDSRVVSSHLSLEKCHEFLGRSDLDAVQNIVLIHLSARNSHKVNFQKSTTELTGKIVTTAEPGQTINFDLNIF